MTKLETVKPRKFDYAEAAALHEAGQTITAIAKKFSVHWVTIKRAIRIENRNKKGK